MKGKTLATCLLSMLVFVFSLPAAAGAMTEAEILDQLKTLRAEQNRLNEAIGKLERALGQTDGSASGKSQEQAGKAGLADRVLNLEKKLEKDSGEKWTDRITLSGVLEVEAGWEKVDYNDPDQDDETARDMTLATVELGVEARIADHVTGSFVLLWQEGETDGVDLDEGYILIDGEEAFRIGLVNQVVDDDKLMEATLALAEKILPNSAFSIRLIKKGVDMAPEVSLEALMDYEVEACLATVFAPERAGALDDFQSRKKK